MAAMKSKFDHSRIHELVAKGNDIELPRAANELTWLALDYMDHLRPYEDEHRTWLSERKGQEDLTVDAFVKLIDNTEAWELVRRLVPEFRDSVESSDITSTAGPLGRLLNAMAHRIRPSQEQREQQPTKELEQKRIQELEQKLQAWALEARMRLLCSNASGEAHVDTEELVEQARSVGSRAREA